MIIQKPPNWQPPKLPVVFAPSGPPAAAVRPVMKPLGGSALYQPPTTYHISLRVIVATLLLLTFVLSIARIVQRLGDFGFGWIFAWLLLTIAIGAALWQLPRMHILLAFPVLGLLIAVAVWRARHNPLFLLAFPVLFATAVYLDQLNSWLGDVRIPVSIQALTSNSYLLYPVAAFCLTFLAANSMSISAAVVLVGFFALVRVGWNRALNAQTRGITLAVGILLLTSAVLSWGGVSVFHRLNSSAVIPSAAERKQVLSSRAAVVASGNIPPVAVLLSGGGYRAAVTHAGLLWALDRAGIPVSVVSTVSGGSIIGGAYAAGWKPEQFRDYLLANPPGLSLDMFDIWNILRAEFEPAKGSGETFASHLGRNYFGSTTFDETGPPALVVNSTRLDTGDRAIFWKGMSAPRPDLAHACAASGAFPGALGPVYIGRSRFIDGGVVENLGTEGLRQYLAADPHAPTPALVIISDLSAEPPPIESDAQPDPVSIALRADSLVYKALLGHIYGAYSTNAYRPDAPSGNGYSVPAATLFQGRSGTTRVFILAPTSEGEVKHLSGAERQLALSVRAISTLVEPSPRQVQAAFWLGATIARSYLPAVCEAVLAKPCPAVAWPRTPELPVNQGQVPVPPSQAPQHMKAE